MTQLKHKSAAYSTKELHKKKFSYSAFGLPTTPIEPFHFHCVFFYQSIENWADDIIFASSYRMCLVTTTTTTINTTTNILLPFPPRPNPCLLSSFTLDSISVSSSYLSKYLDVSSFFYKRPIKSATGACTKQGQSSSTRLSVFATLQLDSGVRRKLP